MCVSPSARWSHSSHTVSFSMLYKDLLSGITGFMSQYIYTRWSIFCGRRIFLFNAVAQFFFTVCLWIRVRWRVMRSWQQRRLLLRDHCIFLSPRLFFLVLLVLLAFSRHMDFQKAFYYTELLLLTGQKVVSHVQYFFFIPHPTSLDLPTNSGQAFIFPQFPSFSCLTYPFYFMLEVTLAD